MPVFEQLDICDDEVRIVAALYAQRRCAEEAAERLIALIDELDAPNEDLEDGADDEPSLSLGHGGAGEGRYCGEVDLELDDADSEPSLGWIHGRN